jgi:hypothetical protein
MPTSKNGNTNGTVLDKLHVEYRIPRGSGFGYKTAFRQERAKAKRTLEDERREFREDFRLLMNQLTAANEHNAQLHKYIGELQREVKRLGGHNGNGTLSIDLAHEAAAGEKLGEKPEERHEEEQETHGA